MNWKKRAQEALGKTGGTHVRATVDEIAAESTTVAADLAFALESAGVSALPPLSLDLDGLKVAERAYRSLARSGGLSDGVFRDQIERLLGIFLGRVLMEEQGGEWVFYRGKYHTVNPVVLKLPSGKHVDVFGFCQGLNVANRVDGARNGEALARFAVATEVVGFP